MDTTLAVPGDGQRSPNEKNSVATCVVDASSYCMSGTVNRLPTLVGCRSKLAIADDCAVDRTPRTVATVIVMLAELRAEPMRGQPDAVSLRQWFNAMAMPKRCRIHLWHRRDAAGFGNDEPVGNDELAVAMLIGSWIVGLFVMWPGFACGRCAR